MEVRISERLNLADFCVCVASFVSFDSRWSETISAARDLVNTFPDLMFRFSKKNHSLLAKLVSPIFKQILEPTEKFAPTYVLLPSSVGA
jgi:hypothetical protein